MANTIPHSIFYPEAEDLIKDPNSTAKLAVDIARLAISANSAIATAEARARGEAQALDVANRNAWGNAVDSTLDQAMAYTDNAFAAAGEGGATDGQVDAAIDRAVIQGRVADSDRLPSGDRTAVGRGDYGILAADHGAVPGTETVNNRWRIQEAIDIAKGRDVIVEGGAEYFFAGTLVMPANSRHVSIKATGPKPAVFYTTGQSYKLIDFSCGDPVVVKTVTANVGINTRGWPVNDTTGVRKGMLCEVISSASWYHDPRPESFPNDARKSEFHKVEDVFDGKVYMEEISNDGYNLANEVVEIRFFEPIFVRLENITVRAVLPPVAQETNAVEGITITGADQPLLIDVNAEGCARNGVRVQSCWRPRSYGGYSKDSNGYYNGYGFVVSGSAHALVDGRITYGSKKGVDISGANCISRHTIIQNCKVFGGGQNSRGENYGWNPDGSVAAHQSGLGAHGPSDTAIYRNNTIIDVQVPFSIKGRTSICENNTIVGRTSGGVFRGITGTHLFVTGNKVLAGYWSLKAANSYVATHIHEMRADSLVTLYANWQSAVGGVCRGNSTCPGITLNCGPR